MAFRFANGAVKEMEMTELEVLKRLQAKDQTEEDKELLDKMISDLEKPEGEEPKEEGEKHYGDSQPSEVVISPRPFGGATSFSDYDEYGSAIDTELHVKEISAIFRLIVDNIFANGEMSLAQKGDAVLSAARELSTRVKNPPTDGRSLLEKAKSFLKGTFTAKTGVATHNPGRIEQGAWDGGSARNELRRWASSDGSGDPDKINWSRYRRGFAAIDPPANKLGDFWGPHHRIRNGSLMTQRSGVIAAFGAAQGARSGQGRPDALSHLNAHRRQFGIGQAEMETLLGASFKELGLPDDLSPGSFTSFKDSEGRWRWLIINTNKFEDREGEIFSEKAHKEYIYFVERTGQYPDLWLWHTPGTRIGQANLVDYVDGFVVHSGVYDAGLEDVAERLSKIQDKIGVSHGYEYLPGDEEDKVYDHYRSFELTLCPAEKAANIWGTGFQTFAKEVKMGFSEEKRKFFVEALGEERVAVLEEKLPALAKELEEEGVNFKEIMAELLPDTPASEDKGSEEKPKEKKDEEPPADAPPADAAPLSIEDRVGTMEGQLSQIASSLQELAAGQKALTDSIGDKVATSLDEALTGRKRPPNGNGEKRPTEDKENEISEESATEKFKIAGEEGDGASKAAAPYVEDFLSGGREASPQK